MIDEKKLIEVLKKHFDADYGEDGRLLYSDHVCTSDDVEDIIKLVEEQPRVGEWILCSEDNMPEDNVPVNVTWVNRRPVSYYEDIKDKPFTATAVYYKGKWYWWDAVVEDRIAEHGDLGAKPIDIWIDVIAWMPLPEPYKEDAEK